MIKDYLREGLDINASLLLKKVEGTTFCVVEYRGGLLGQDVSMVDLLFISQNSHVYHYTCVSELRSIN